jgi:sugar/nucleoside kinase (ribokinase family)
LDPGWDVQNWQTGRREEILALLPFVDTFLPNREEAMGLSSKTSPEEMAHYLYEAGAEEVIIKLDKGGSAGYSRREGFVKSEAISVKAVDTTAAGEVFNAGVLWGLIQGWKLKKRLTCANTIAGLFVSDPERKYPGLEKVQECLMNKKTEYGGIEK